MAQGAAKLKSKGQGLKKEKNRHKKQQMKKGARTIAPKKAKHMEQAQMKKGLEKMITANIEQEITSKVKSIEAKSFHIITGPSTSDSKTKDSTDSAKSKKK